MRNKFTILHVHQDYPDSTNRPFTMAVKNLIDAAKENDEYEHKVLSINRQNNPFRISLTKFEEGYVFNYFSLPIPIIHQLSVYLHCLYIYLVILKKERFTLIHGHKLTVEGLFARYLSSLLKSKFVISVRGGSDSKLLKRFKKFPSTMQKTFEAAEVVFFVSPWMKKNPIIQTFNKPKASILLPNICKIEHNIAPQEKTEKSYYVTVLSFHQYKRKGLFQLLESISSLSKKGIYISLRIYGGGEDSIKDLIANKIKSLNLSEQVVMNGQVPLNELVTKISESKGLLLPSRNETFGMVYIESISVGTPIMYHSDTGIDGYNLPGIPVDSQDVPILEQAITDFESKYTEIKSAAMNFCKSKDMSDFRSSTISETYLKNIKHTCNKTNSFAEE